MANRHHEDVVEYYDQFVHAIKRTEAWQLNPGDISMNRSVRYVNEQSEKYLVELYNKYIVEIPEERWHCCVSVSYYLVDLVSDYFNTDAYLTIGNVHDFETIFYECSEEYLSEKYHWKTCSKWLVTNGLRQRSDTNARIWMNSAS